MAFSKYLMQFEFSCPRIQQSVNGFGHIALPPILGKEGVPCKRAGGIRGKHCQTALPKPFTGIVSDNYISIERAGIILNRLLRLPQERTRHVGTDISTGPITEYCGIAIELAQWFIIIWNVIS